MTTEAREGEQRALWGKRAEVTRVSVGGVEVGGPEFVVIAGPCAVESEAQVETTADAVAASGARLLRGGVFKPRTSPYSFQGLGLEGLALLHAAGARVGLPVVAEVMSEAQIEAMLPLCGALQVGARNMQNFMLLKALGRTRVPVLLKRGMASTVDEWLLAAEYILDGGNPNVILCERGIRTFEHATRFTLDLAGVAVAKARSHLPVLVDPSHATGSAELVAPMAYAAAAAGADGVMVEVHPLPAEALSDGPQALTPEAFTELMARLAPFVHAAGTHVRAALAAADPPGGCAMSAEVQRMFASIAPGYDRTNQVLSLGIHRLWRRTAVRLGGARPGLRALDCATGTGDSALALKRAVGAEGEVVGTDFCAEMLVPAPAKAARAGLEVAFQVADAMELPFESARFDLATIAFGIRNVDNPVKCLKELARVVKPGGRVVVLEFGQPRGLFGALFRFYSRHVMPRLGGLLTGNREAYEYLPRTSAAFPAGAEFIALMDQSGAFTQREAHPLTFGTAFVYVGQVR